MESDEQLARRLQLEEESSITQLPRDTISDSELARLLQNEEEAGKVSALSEPHGQRGFFGLHGSRGFPSDFEGPLRMRKEIKGLGWRQVFVRVCGSTLAVFSDEKQSKAELEFLLTGAALLESTSQGKLRSMKDEIFRWKITIASDTLSSSDDKKVTIDSGKRGKGVIEFAAADDAERATWLGWCVVAGATAPASAELTAKAFKPLLSAPATVARARALQTLADLLVTNKDSLLQNDALTKALGAAGVLELVAECLRSSPGQESAAQCAYFVACADRQAAGVLVATSAAPLLLPLLTAPDDNLQRWAAAALAPILAGDPYPGAKGVIEGGGVFTIVALLSSPSPDIRSHALAALVSLCSAVVKEAWPKMGSGSTEARSLMCTLIEAAIDAGLCRCISPLLRNRNNPNVATAALETITVMSLSSSLFRQSLRRQIGNDEHLTAELVVACSNQRLGWFILRVLADACYCIDYKTWEDERGESAAAADAARALFSAGGLHISMQAITLKVNSSLDLAPSLFLESAARKGAENRGHEHVTDSRRDDGARIIAAIVTHAPGAAEQCAFSKSACMLPALVSLIAFDVAPSLNARDGQPQAAAALCALIHCIIAGGRENAAGPAIEAAQAGLIELIDTHGFLNTNLIQTNFLPSRIFIAARAAMLVHIFIDACWCEANAESLLILALATPPNGHVLSKLCNLLHDLVSSELATPDLNRGVAHVDSLMTALLLALGSLCGASRPFGHVAHPSEPFCKLDVAHSPCCGLAIAANLTPDHVVLHSERRHAAARLLAALARHDDNEKLPEIEYSFQGRDAVATALGRAGLIGVAATCLDDRDINIRANAVDAFTSLSLYAQGEDRDLATGAAALGNVLTQSDATTKQTDINIMPLDLVKLRITTAVEKAANSLNLACHRCGAIACNTVVFSSECRDALISLMRAPVSAPSKFGVRCAGTSLSTVIALARDQGRATLLANSGTCDAVASILVETNVNSVMYGSMALAIESMALATLSTFAAFPALRRALASTKLPMFEILFFIIANVQDQPSFKRAYFAISVLLHFTHPIGVVAEPLTAVRLSLSAKRAKAMEVLTAALNGSWRIYCDENAKNDAIIQAARQIITTLANAPNYEADNSGALLGKFVVQPVRGQETTTTLLDSSEDSKSSLQSSSDLICDDDSHHFEHRYSKWAQRLRTQVSNGAPARSKSVVFSNTDTAALVSLITAPVPADNAERIKAHASAVDCASVALENLIVEDASGAATTDAIQGGAMTRLLALAPHSQAAADCLVALCRVGELHRPLLLAIPTPVITIRFVDIIVNMLCVSQHAASTNESDLEIVRASLHILSTICLDSDAALFAFSITMAARGKLSPAVSRLATLTRTEAALEASTYYDREIALPATLTLISMLSPRLQDILDDNDYLCGFDQGTRILFTASASEHIPIKSLLGASATDACRIQVIARHVACSGLMTLLEAAALNAVAKAAPALLHVLQRLPSGALRARARRVIATVISMSSGATRSFHGAAAIGACVKLIVDRNTGTADTALGLGLLKSLADASKGHAVHAVLDHDDLLPALVTRVIQASLASDLGSLAFSALSLLANLANASHDATVYVSLREDLLETVGTLASRNEPQPESMGPSTAIPIETSAFKRNGVEWHQFNTPPSFKEQMPIESLGHGTCDCAVLVLTHIAMGGVSQRNIIAETHGVFDSAIRALQAADSGSMVQAAAFQLTACILQGRNSTDLTAEAAAVAVDVLVDTFSAMIKGKLRNHGELSIFLHLLPVINAVSYHKQGANALRSPEVAGILVALLGMTAKQRSDVAEACAAQISALCRDPYHVNILKSHHFIPVLLKALKVKHAVALHFHCLSILDCITRSCAWSGLNVHAVPGADASITLCNLTYSDHVMTPTTIRLAKLLGLK
jgi:hypothetical protein